ncbi:MAG: hypothetical protein GC208_10375 [Alphaproteobacteria bacterium]|nr:hypothetical protein [Alphaproteobacteria bacterium]
MADEEKDKTPETKKDPVVDPAKAAAADQKKVDADLVTIPRADLTKLEERINTLGKRFDDDQTARSAEAARASVARAANDLGANDPEYFGFLAEKERTAKGKDFDLAAFGKELKTKRPDLFKVAPGATTTAGHDNSPEKITTLQTQFEDARKKGDVATMLNLKSELTRLGATPK